VASITLSKKGRKEEKGNCKKSSSEKGRKIRKSGKKERRAAYP